MQYLKKNTQTIRNFIYYYLVGENDGLLLYASNDSSNNVFFFFKERKKQREELFKLFCFACFVFFSSRPEKPGARALSCLLVLSV